MWLCIKYSNKQFVTTTTLALLQGFGKTLLCMTLLMCKCACYFKIQFLYFSSKFDPSELKILLLLKQRIRCAYLQEIMIS